MKKYIKRILIVVGALCILSIGALFIADSIITSRTKNYIFDSEKEIPYKRVALVLGTAKNLKNGYPNKYFVNRIEAAKELYDAGKVSVFVLSGDNSRKDYNEPQDMKDALIAKGVPDSIIHLDYAGLRTLDSVVRLNEIFGQTSFTIVSQKFHNERAIYIAQYYGLEAYGYNAIDVSLNKRSIKTKIREKFARVKVFVDILTGKSPKYLGEKINI